MMTKSGSLRNSMQKCGKILPGRKDTRDPVVSTLRGQATPPFRRLCVYSVGLFVIKTRFAFLLVKMDWATDSGSEWDKIKVRENRVTFFAKRYILRVLQRPSWISSKYYLLHMYEKKCNPIFFSSRSYSEPESVAKSVLTNKQKAKLQMDLHYVCICI